MFLLCIDSIKVVGHGNKTTAHFGGNEVNCVFNVFRNPVHCYGYSCVLRWDKSRPAAIV